MSNKSSNVNFKNLIFTLVGVIAFLLLFVGLVHKSYTGHDFTSFGSFLNWLSDLHTFQINVSITDFLIYGDWGIFNFLRDFINVFATIIGVAVFLGSNILNLLIYISQFIIFLFS